jgi:hypothetical protein
MLIRSLKKVLRGLRSIYKLGNSEMSLAKWKLLSTRGSRKDQLRSHMLLVKNLKYVKIAETCIYSFLFYHPNSQVTIHCDTITFDQANITFRKLIERGRVHPKLIEESEKKTWQEMKMSVLLNLNGSSDFFMDADLRWNGISPSTSGIHFFVKEFQLKTQENYQKILLKLNDPRYRDAFMWNTSYFTFAGIHETSVNLREVSDLEKEIKKIIDCTEFNMVEKDGHKDGSFLESSYYGATGTVF